MTKNEMLLEITVAVWFDLKLSQVERFQERLSILADLNGRLDRSIDCIDLDSSDPHLVHQVFTDRIIEYESN